MTPSQIKVYLKDSVYFKNATKKEIDCFCGEMKYRNYGKYETIDAWIWFHLGWKNCMQRDN